MGNKGVLAFGIILVLVGVGLIFTSGVDFSNLPVYDLTARIGDAEITATEISQEAETKIISGFVIAIIGIVLVIVGK